MRNSTISGTKNSVSVIPTSVFDTTTLLSNKASINISAEEHNSGFELLDKYPLIRNAERNNVSGLPGTVWTITDIDAVNKWITLDNYLPNELLELGTGITERWSLFNTTGTVHNYRIVATDFTNNRVQYGATNGGLNNGDVVTFFNAFRQWYPISYSTILPLDLTTWSATYLYPGPVWKHSDGNYRMLISGWDGAFWSNGLGSSPDLISWTVLNGGNWLYRAGTTPFDKAWMTLHLQFTGNAINIPGTSNYACLVKAYDGTANQIGICTFDEDFTILTVSTNTLDFCTLGAGENRQFGSLIYYNNKWYVGSCHRKTPQSASIIYFFEVTNIYTCTIGTPVVIQDSSVANTWCALTLEYVNLLIYNCKLYMYVSGEADGADATVGGICTGNREHGLYVLGGLGWEIVKQNPYFVNPVDNANAYTDLGSVSAMRDHTGGPMSFITDSTGTYALCIMRGTGYLAYTFKLNE